jgi:hypothetical protein
VSALRADLEPLIEARATPEQVSALRADLEPLIEARATPEQVSELHVHLDRQIEACVTLEQVGALRVDVEAKIAAKADPAQYEALIERVRNELVQRYTAVEDWLRGGAGYQAFSLCKHDGALWQSLRATTGTPGLSEDWVLLADGLSTITFEANGPQHAKMVAAMTSGRVAEHTFRLPIPKFRGVYVEGGEYEAWDTVAKDSHVFLCLRDTPTGAPGEVQGEWQVFSGPRGKPGKRADDGAIKTAILRELVPQIQAAVDAR